MNPLLKKEIRLVLPAWLAVLLLEVGQPWFIHDLVSAVTLAPVFFFFGMVLLAVDSFGREFSLGTFSSLMAQPLERREIWRMKIKVLLAGAALVFTAYFISCELRLHLAFENSLLSWHPDLTNDHFGMLMAISLALMLAALTGGLWTALLLRQVSAAFWIALLVPMGLLMLTMFLILLFRNASVVMVFSVLFTVTALYIAFAFRLAHQLFYQAEDAGWTGGVISFSKWRYFEKINQSIASRRSYRPMVAFLKKEFQLHSISLFGAAVILGLHILVLVLRGLYTDFHRDSIAAVITDGFWLFWLVIPLVMGCTAVAEERKLGLADGQSCLPVSRRFQFVLKLLPTMIVGMVLGGIVPVFLEALMARWGDPGVFFKPDNNVHLGLFSELGWLPVWVIGGATALAWVGFFASTLAKNFLQALSIAILLIIGLSFSGSLIAWLIDEQVSFLGLMPMPWILLMLTGIPILAGTFLWLGYRNFVLHLESGRLWGRNLGGFAGALLLVLAISTTTYCRCWEIFEPAELPHGSPIFSLANPPRLQGSEWATTLQARLPDGRVWCDSLENFYWGYPNQGWKQLWMRLVDPTPTSDGPNAYVAGSNWISMATGHIHYWEGQKRLTGALNTVGIRADGTLWSSSDNQPGVWNGASMLQFGRDNDWRQVVRINAHLWLLKTNHTLWQWGTNGFEWDHRNGGRPSIRNFQPKQLGTNADWQEIFSGVPNLLRKTDGSVCLAWPNGKDDLQTQTATNYNYNSVSPQTFSGLAYVGKDGSLWVANARYFNNVRRWEAGGFIQIGRETNWVAVAGASEEKRLVALKNDGTLWKWDFISTTIEALKMPPARLGIHNDWVALATAPGGAASLAADGSLWLWPDAQFYQPSLIRLPKQPKFIANIFAAN